MPLILERSGTQYVAIVTKLLSSNKEESNSFVCTHVKNGHRRYQERIYLSINVYEGLGKCFSFAKAF